MALHRRGQHALLAELVDERDLLGGQAVLARRGRYSTAFAALLAPAAITYCLLIAARTIYPGHGPTVFDAAGKLEEYVEHRAMRERQVLEAIRAGRATIGDMVPVIYAEYPVELHELAARQVLSQLAKLEREGRVARKGPAETGTYEVVEPRSCQRCGKPAMPRSTYCARCSAVVMQEGPG